MKRIFIVGCSRSGTTILQKHLAERFSFWTLPETGYFLPSARGWKELNYRIYSVLYRSGLILPQQSPPVKSYLYLSRLVKLLGPLRALGILLGRGNRTSLFCQLMDRLTPKDCQGWVEKTPLHILSMEELLRVHPEAQVLVLIRNGLDTVASIVDRSRKYPEIFAGQDIDYAVGLWNQCLSIAEEYQNHPRVHLVRFETFCTSPQEVLRDLANPLELHYQESGTKTKTLSYKEKQESWKMGTEKEVALPPGKAKTIFNEEEIRAIEARLRPVGR